MPAAEDSPKRTHRVTDILTSTVAVIGLCTLAPIVNFIAFNALEPRFSAGRALQYALVIGAAGLVVALVLQRLLTRMPRHFSRTYVGLAVLITLNGYLIDLLVFGGTFEEAGFTPRARYVLLVYGLLLLLAVAGAWFLARRPMLLAVCVVGIAGFTATDALSYAYSMYANSAGLASVEASVREAAPERERRAALDRSEKPNVYFVIPDMMVGRHIFSDFGVDTKIFGELAGMGFVVPERAYANAPVTTFSMMHTLSMKYFLRDGGRIEPAELAAIQRKVEEPELYRQFKKRNYRIIAVQDGYHGHCGKLVDRCISRVDDDADRQYQDVRFLDRTPFIRALDVLDMKSNLFDPPLNLWAFPDRMEIPEILDRMPLPQEGPFLYVLHHALPHYPLRFDRDCRSRRFADLNVAYGEQLACAAKQMRRVAARIIEADPTAIIILQADHGISFDGQHLKRVSSLTESELEENFNIFAAYKLPEDCRGHIGDFHTPVNTFRIVLACLDGREPELLDNRMFAVYYPRWPSGGHVREWHLK